MRQRARLLPSAVAARLSLLCAILAVLLGGCGTTPHPKATLRLPLYGPLGAPDPALASTSAGKFLDSLLYSGLVKFGPDLHIVPELAVSLPTIGSNGRTYTFTVRQDCRFTGGRRCTAADVAYSLARPLTPAVHSPLARRAFSGIAGSSAVWNGATPSLSGVRVLDKLTIRIQLKQPDADFLEKLASPAAVLVNRRAIRGTKIRSWFAPAGTGAWSVTGRTRGGIFTLTPRRHAYGTLVQVRALSLVPVRSVATGLDLYRQGDIDAAVVPDDRYQNLVSTPDLHTSPGLDAYYAVPATPAPGLAARLDRATLLQHANPALTPLASIVPPAIPDYISSPPQFPPAVSARASAIKTARGNTIEETLRASLVRQWGPVTGSGARIRLIHVWHSLPDPSLWLRIVLPNTDSVWFRHLVNRAGRLTNDPVTRMASYSRCETWALQQGLIIPLASGSVAYVIKPSVQNLQVTPLGLMPANNSWAMVSVS